jgi:hypothetical protein
MTSVRLILLNWLERLGNHIAEYAVDRLSRYEIHFQSGANNSLRNVAEINSRMGKGHCDGSVVLTGLSDEINKTYWDSAVPNHPSLITYLECLPASNDDFIGHSFISPENAKALGEQGVKNIRQYESNLREANRYNTQFGQNLAKSRGAS